MNDIIRLTAMEPAARGRIATSTGEVRYCVETPSRRTSLQLQATSQFEARAAEVEKDLDTLDAKLSDMKALLDPAKFAAGEEAELKAEMIQVSAVVDYCTASGDHSLSRSLQP